jgi:hypothetical protein
MVPEASMHGEIFIEDLKAIICRCLYMDIFWIKLKERLDLYHCKDSLTIRELFKVMNNPSYVADLPTTYNNRNVSSNVKLIKSAAYLNAIKMMNFEDIRKAGFAYTLVENMNTGCVFPANPQMLSIGLKYTGKVMSENLIEYWLQKVKDRMVRNDIIMPFEFLYLCINAKDRERAIKKLPLYDRSINRDVKSSLFTIDTCTRFNPSPDRRIQRSLNSEIQPLLNMMTSSEKKVKTSPKGRSRSMWKVGSYLRKSAARDEKVPEIEAKTEASTKFRNTSQNFVEGEDLMDSLNSLKAHVRTRLGSVGLDNKRNEIRRRKVFSLVDQSLLEILQKIETNRHRRLANSMRNVAKRS